MDEIPRLLTIKSPLADDVLIATSLVVTESLGLPYAIEVGVLGSDAAMLPSATCSEPTPPLAMPSVPLPVMVPPLRPAPAVMLVKPAVQATLTPTTHRAIMDKAQTLARTIGAKMLGCPGETLIGV